MLRLASLTQHMLASTPDCSNVAAPTYNVVVQEPPSHGGESAGGRAALAAKPRNPDARA